MRAACRDDLTTFAIVAPVLITLWGMALEISGDVVASDRSLGVVEQVVAAPTPSLGAFVIVAPLFDVALPWRRIPCSPLSSYSWG